MEKRNFYTGELIQDNHPPDNTEFISEAEAVHNASFGANFSQTQYGLGGNIYQQQSPGFNINPNYSNPAFARTTYGNPFLFNSEGYNPYPNYFNPAQGFVSPYQQPMMQYGNPYQNQFYSGGYSANPAFQFMNQPYFQQQQQQDMYIAPVNLSGNDYLPMKGFEEEIQNMMTKVIDDQMEADARNIAERSKAYGQYNPYVGMNNYYCMPVYAQRYSSYTQDVYNKIREMKDQARKARIDFSINLSKMVHNYLNDGVDDETIERMYTGERIDAQSDPYISDYYRQLSFQKRMQNLVEYDPAAKYREAALRVNNEIRSCLPQDENATAEEVAQGFSKLISKWNQEEEDTRRRSFTVDYKTDGNNSYKYLVRRRKAEAIANSQGYSLDPNTPMQIINQINKNKNSNFDKVKKDTQKEFKQAMLDNLFPELRETGSYIDEDGALVAKLRLPEQPIDRYNENENEYEAKKAGFNSFLSTIPKINLKPKEIIEAKQNSFNSFIGDLLSKPTITEDSG